MIKLLCNPFEKYSEYKLLILGLLATIVGGFMGFYFDGFYEGFLDLKFYTNVTFFETVVSLVINILSIFFLLCLLGKFINAKTRLIDVFVTVLIARVPVYILNFSNYDGFAFDVSKDVIAA